MLQSVNVKIIDLPEMQKWVCSALWGTGQFWVRYSRVLQPSCQEGRQHLKDLREQGWQAPGQCCNVHSVVRFPIHRWIIAWYVITYAGPPPNKCPLFQFNNSVSNFPLINRNPAVCNMLIYKTNSMELSLSWESTICNSVHSISYYSKIHFNTTLRPISIYM
jgi:hypothetical protein